MIDMKKADKLIYRDRNGDIKSWYNLKEAIDYSTDETADYYINDWLNAVKSDFPEGSFSLGFISEDEKLVQSWTDYT